MSSLWVVNASPIITLAKIGQLRLIEELSESYIVPDAVAAEISAGLPADPARIVVASGWGPRATPTQIPDAVLEWGLGSGETAAIALALERAPATAVLDDAAARAAARALGVPLLGTLGIVIRAKIQGRVDSAARLIADLQSAGLHLHEATIRAALKQIGEDREGAV